MIGEWHAAGTFSQGSVGVRQFTMPGPEDWVLVVSRQGALEPVSTPRCVPGSRSLWTTRTSRA